MNYRGLGFFSPSYDLAPPPPIFRQQVVFLSQSCVLSVELTDVRGGEGGGGVAKSYDIKKAWSCVNHSILSSGS